MTSKVARQIGNNRDIFLDTHGPVFEVWDAGRTTRGDGAAYGLKGCVDDPCTRRHDGGGGKTPLFDA